MDSEERRRYSRQIAVDGIGESGQEKLLSAKVMIVGCGALGSMVAMQLAGAGVGNITIADFDTIDISNLQRQFFYSTGNAGKKKSEMLAERMKELNPAISVEIVDKLITESNATDYFKDKDFIVDATDNSASKVLIDKICGMLAKPCCIGGVAGMHGQVVTLLPDSLRFEEMFTSVEDTGMTPCSVAGVLGPAASMCASIQAAEVMKYITGVGELLEGRMLTFNLATNAYHVYKL